MAEQFSLPIIPIDNAFVFPNTVQQVDLSYYPSKEIEQNLFSDQHECVVVLSKKPISSDLSTKDLALDSIYTVGVRAEVVHYNEMSNYKVRVLLDGQTRVYIHSLTYEGDIMLANVTHLSDYFKEGEDLTQSSEAVYQLFKSYLDTAEELPPETLLSVLDIQRPSLLSDLISSYLPMSVHDKQTLLEELKVSKRLDLVKHYLNEHIIDINLEKNIDSLVQDKVDRERRDLILKAKLRAIQDELNQTSQEDEFLEYRKRLEALNLPFESTLEVEKELNKLDRTPEGSSEAGNIRNYLDFILSLAWNKKSAQTVDIKNVIEVLNQQHYGLDDVKERIMEYLAVRKLSKKTMSNILCLAGPPGVGKTSIVKSVAKALGREFSRISLGGVRDEAELRGHRRTYVGALPGKIVSALYKAQSMNPVILLDELDKIASGFKGDPSSVLLEVLDPEQNDTFMDHYLQLPVDLSDVLFVCTANNLNDVPDPLRNRLEIIRISGYGLEEKVELGKRYLCPSLIVDHGLEEENLQFSKDILRTIINHYTTDVGLRELSRCIQRILRKIALQKVSDEKVTQRITPKCLQKFLGPGIPKPSFSSEPRVGRSVALYSVGMIGNILPIETVIFPGSGKNIITGNIDPLLSENITTAVSFLKKHHTDFKLPKQFLKDVDLHTHFHKPELLKKGEGWGLAVFSSILSTLLEAPLPATVAFSGEISLLGKVLPTHDLEQKLLAAAQLGIKTVVVSSWNFDDQGITIPEQIKVIPIKMLKELYTLLHKLSPGPGKKG